MNKRNFIKILTEIDYIRQRIRIYCYIKSYYGLFLLLSTEKELKIVENGLNMIDEVRLNSKGATQKQDRRMGIH